MLIFALFRSKLKVFKHLYPEVHFISSTQVCSFQSKTHYKMDAEISQPVEMYKELSNVPVATSAVILPDLSEKVYCIHSFWNSQDLVKSEKSAFSRNYLIEKSSLNVLFTGIINDASTMQLQAFSKSGKQQAILQEKKLPEEKVFLEIWTGLRKEKTFDLTDCKKHGKINKNDAFGCFKWSSDEKYLLYTAEEKREKSVSYFKNSSEKKEGEEEKIVKGEEYLYREEWGESFNGLHHSVLCTLEIETGNIEILPLGPLGAEISVGQAIWGPNDESIVFVGWSELPYRLGVWACMNRRSGIYSIDLKSKQIELISDKDNICARSPSFSPNFDSLIYLENKAHGPHRKGATLKKYDWKNKKLSTVVGIIARPQGEEFPGLYEVELPLRCWSEDGKHVFFSTFWRSRVNIICVNIDNGHVQRIETGEDFGSARVLDVCQDIIIAQVSSPSIEPCLVFGHINTENKAVIDWKFLDGNSPVKYPDVKWDILKITPSLQNATFPDLDYDIIVLRPADLKKKQPLIVIPHGGPHSCFPASFMIRPIGYVRSGFIVCIVNYRGSFGFGEDNLNSLPGNVGTQDVADVQNAALYVKNKCNFDIGDVFIYGGSHGGFLTAHLCGQFPDFYKAAVLLNPVIDISAMISVSDIPDWCWVEGGCGDEMNSAAVVQPDHLKCMWEKSPIKHAEKVCAPTLLLLGNKDLRVPMSQGIMYYHLLKSRNVPVRVYQYDDNHILSKTPINADVFMQTLMWFKKHSSCQS